MEQAMVIALAMLVLFESPTVSLPTAEVVRIEGRVVDQSRLPLPGVTVRLLSSSIPSERSTVTTASGEYSFDVEGGGTYRIEAELDGFERATCEVRADKSPVVADLTLALAHFAQETTVIATAPTEVQPRQFAAPATIAESVIANAPLRTNRFDDVLPLVPTVVRGPDGLISIAGARAPQGIALLDGVPGLDVVSGEPIAAAPLAAVESVQVITTGYPAEFGQSAGGVTMINSRPGGDAFHFSVNSFSPRPRLRGGTVQGIESWEPNVGVRGPIAKSRVWFSQALDYRFNRTAVYTLAGDQDRRQNNVLSLTQVDAQLSSSHLLTVLLNVQADDVEGERLNAFSSPGSVPDLRRHLYSTTFIDRTTVGRTATLETRVQVERQQKRLVPIGDAPYVIAHDVTRGSYFEAREQDAVSLYASSVLGRVWSRRGNHVTKVGVTVRRDTADGAVESAPVAYLRSNLQPAATVTFSGTGAFDVRAHDVALFAQDGWDLSNRVRLDAGMRLDAGYTVPALVTPRAGLTWAVSDRTTVTGGAGLFADKVTLAALAFPQVPARTVATFGANAARTPFVNRLDPDLRRPFAAQWSVQVEERLGQGWRLRVDYQERHGYDELIVATASEPNGMGWATLESSGTSRSRTLATTLGLRAGGPVTQFYVSYARSASRGNTNDLNRVEGFFRQPLLLPDSEAPLPVDVPHRLLVWGLFSLPSRITIAPFLEARSGFPYSALRDDWTFAEVPNTRRYPPFVALDLVVNKTVTLPTGLKARVGVKIYNLTDRQNGRDVQADLARPDFGTTYNALGRQLRGVFEIIWGGSAK